MIKLSPQPIYQGHLRITGAIPINQTHVSSTNSGNGILTLPGTGESINVTSNWWAIFSHILQFGQGEVTITTTEQEDVGVLVKRLQLLDFMKVFSSIPLRESATVLW
jgi:hypothetical protein